MAVEYKFDMMSRTESSEAIRQLFIAEAAGFCAAKETLRTVFDSNARKEALEMRDQHLEHCDALLDAYLEVQAEHWNKNFRPI